MLRPGHDTSCPYKNRCEFFNFTELRLDAIALRPCPPTSWRTISHRLVDTDLHGLTQDRFELVGRGAIGITEIDFMMLTGQ